jgi:RNA polymerase sigma-70 factor (ECF subfamily)
MSHSAVIPLFPTTLRHKGGFEGDDAALVAALRSGDPAARAALFDRYGEHVQRVLINIMGFDTELADLLQEVFARALSSINTLSDGGKLKAWLASIAVFTARGCIRSRRRRRWLGFAPPERLNRCTAPSVSEEVREAVRSTYEVLSTMPADERIVFSLRHIAGLELTELAETCDVSLATIKRRLAKARKRFVALARHRPALRSWLEEEVR